MKIPRSTLESLERYVKDRIKTGGFLQAVLENNLKESFARADVENTAALKDIVGFIHNYLPAICWGSPQRVADWLARVDQQDPKFADRPNQRFVPDI